MGMAWARRGKTGALANIGGANTYAGLDRAGFERHYFIRRRLAGILAMPEPSRVMVLTLTLTGASAGANTIASIVGTGSTGAVVKNGTVRGR